MEAEATASVLPQEPQAKTSLAAATFVLNGQRLIRLAYQDHDGNIRQGNSNSNVWAGTPGILITKDLVQPSTALAAVGWPDEVYIERPLDLFDTG